MYSSVSPTKLQANRIVQLLFWLVVNIFYWEGSWLFKWTGTWEATRTVHPISTFSQQIAFCSIGLSLYFRPKGGGDGDDKNDVVYTDDDVDDDVLERKEEIPKKYNFVTQHKSPMSVDSTCNELSEYVRLWGSVKHWKWFKRVFSGKVGVMTDRQTILHLFQRFVPSVICICHMYTKFESFCVPFGHRVGESIFLEIYICIG